MVPVVRALIIHWRSRVLNGISTILVLLSKSLALSGYMTWWVVLVPTSTSKPAVGAWFILHGQKQKKFLFLAYFLASSFAAFVAFVSHIFFMDANIKGNNTITFFPYCTSQNKYRTIPGTNIAQQLLLGKLVIPFYYTQQYSNKLD